MKPAAEKTTHSPSTNNAPIIGAVIGMDVLNTAWRIAVPIILAAVLGIIADRSFDTAPWITLSATVVGMGVSAWLVKLQLAALEKAGR